MKVLVINCGSSSLKYQLIDSESEEVLAKGLVERIGIPGSVLTHRPEGKDKVVIETPMEDHNIAVKLVIDALVDKDHGVISDLSEIGAVGHRVVHGGEKFNKAVLINDAVKKDIEELSALAPLHNPANLIGINACEKNMPGVPQAAIFDTAFHQTMPKKAYMYGIPYEYYEKYKVRRYGFHGTSHDYVSARAAEILGKDRKDLKIVVCHLGNGASISAVKNGECVDTSMGLTPLEGLIMGTRSGDLDPAILDYIGEKENLSAKEVNTILNKKSGILGLSGGVSSDFRDIDAAIAEGNEKAKTALDTYCYRVAKYIASYAVALGGIDVIAFTAGVGENNYVVRKQVSDYLAFLGVKTDDEKLKIRGEEIVASTPDSKITIMIVPTNEELAIARQTLALL
ncbi:MAG: Acetate kinase [Firmicutes bacterium ADurb.Bin354]|nr:MAG: Acetate kinase [Firmicutes bacterium ADurb.Bin354]